MCKYKIYHTNVEVVPCPKHQIEKVNTHCSFSLRHFLIRCNKFLIIIIRHNRIQLYLYEALSK